MRTTLDIDEDVLLAAKELAKSSKKTAGEIISELARKALIHPDPATPPSDLQPEEFFGILPLPHRGGIVTSELVRQLMDEEGI